MIMKSTAKCGFNIIIKCNVMFLLVTDFATPIWHRPYRPVDFMVDDSNSIKTKTELFAKAQFPWYYTISVIMAKSCTIYK